MAFSSEPCGTNFCFPVPKTLENDRVLLTPFVPSKHVELFVSQTLLYPELFKLLLAEPYKDTEDFTARLLEPLALGFDGLLFAVYDKTKSAPSEQTFEHHSPSAFAGIVQLSHSSTINLVTEIGPLIILPPFQRTHVTSNTVGLLLHYSLDLPSFSSPAIQISGPTNGLGLRRVCYQANNLNKASALLAERMGFKLTGVIPWSRALPATKAVGSNGKEVRKGDPRENWIGIDTVMYNLCWDDWVQGVRDAVDLIMLRGL